MQTQYQDQVAGLIHGDVLVSELSGERMFQFRCGAVAGSHFRVHDKGTQFRRKAYGSYRHPRTLRSKALGALHWLEGVYIRYNSTFNLPSTYDDVQAHAERGWKHQRKVRHQWQRK